jgi:acetoin utilization deacetylase AcuC-like enzyme
VKREQAMVSIFYDDQFLDHDTGFYHPENAGRLQAITQALRAAPWADQIQWRSPTSPNQAGDRLWDALYAIHTRPYVESVHNLAVRGGGHLDPDTVVSPRSYDVALLAVSAWLDGVDWVLQTGEPAFVLARPPGHHALGDRGMGFCLFSNAAIAAHYALTQPPVQRVAILDWDVHHGNGTQAIVESHPQIFYCSLHQYPHYPGTGAPSEQGMHHNVLNLPMAAGNTMEEYEPLFKAKVLPFLQQAQPDLLIVSAGYDANRDDPLAGIALQPEDYGMFTRLCRTVTNRILLGLEGGYDYGSLSQSVLATLEACLGKPT